MQRKEILKPFKPKTPIKNLLQSFLKPFLKTLLILILPFIFISCNSSNDTNTKELKELIVSPTEINLRVHQVKTLSIEAIYKDNTREILQSAINYNIQDSSIVSYDSSTNKLKALKQGSTTISFTKDNITSNIINITIYPALNTSNISALNFASLYINSIPVNASKTTYDEKLFSMIRGNIYDINDEPLEDVKVSVLDNDDYGWLLSKSNGTYTLGIEGGKDINVVYSKNGYISVHRKVYALPNDWTIVASVNMVKT